jgi:8-oxo-dGTP pyrophosphatase MutT (NUDIX family)
MTKDNSWKTLSSKLVYKNNWINVKEDHFVTPQGKEGVFGIIETRQFVIIIPKIKNQFFLIETYRYPIKEWSLEFPAGGIEEGDSVEKTVHKELKEEVGLTTDCITKLGFFYSASGISNAGFHIYVAEDCNPTSRELEDLEEGMKVKKYTEEELKKMISEGRIIDSQTVTAFYTYLLKYPTT